DAAGRAAGAPADEHERHHHDERGRLEGAEVDRVEAGGAERDRLEPGVLDAIADGEALERGRPLEGEVGAEADEEEDPRRDEREARLRRDGAAAAEARRDRE